MMIDYLYIHTYDYVGPPLFLSFCEKLFFCLVLCLHDLLVCSGLQGGTYIMRGEKRSKNLDAIINQKYLSRLMINYTIVSGEFCYICHKNTEIH